MPTRQVWIGSLIVAIAAVQICALSRTHAQSVGVECQFDRFVGSFPTSGSANGVAVSGKHALVANNNSTVDVFDLTDPTKPELVATVNTPGPALYVDTISNVAYVAGGSAGIYMLDIGDSSAPTFFGTYDAGSDVRVVRAYGNRLFAAGPDGLLILEADMSGMLQQIGSYVDSWVNDICVEGDYAYIGTQNGIRVVDISDPQLPVELGFWGAPSSAAITRLAVQNGKVYAIYPLNSSASYLVDFTDVQAPVLVRWFATQGVARSVLWDDDEVIFGTQTRGIQGYRTDSLADHFYNLGVNRTLPCLDLDVAGDLVVAASGADGLSVFNLDSWRPSLVAAHEVPSIRPPHGRYVAVEDTIAIFVYTSNGRSSPSGLDILDISDPSQPELLSTYPAQDPTGVAISGSLAYVANGPYGVDVLDVANPLSPIRINQIATPDDALFVFVDNSVLYVAAENAGLLVFDISDPSSPTLLGSYDTPGAAYVVQVRNGVAYLADSSFVRLLDVSEPASISELGAVDVNLAWDLTVDFPHVYIPNGESGLAVIDISNPASPTIVGEYDTAFCHGITHQGTKVYLTDHFALNIFDVSDPTNPVLIGVHDTPGDSEDVTVANGFAYVPDWDGGLQIFDINSDCSTPCPPDTNHDGTLSPADFTAWIAAFNAQAPECDQNADGSCTPADFTAWIANYNAGC